MNFTTLPRIALAVFSFFALFLILPANARASAGDFIIGDTGANTVYRITPGGTKTVLSNAVGGPTSLAFDASGNLFVSDNTGHKIFKVTPDGTVSTFGPRDTVLTPQSASRGSTPAAPQQLPSRQAVAG